MYTVPLFHLRFRFFSPKRRINVNLVRSRQELFDEYLLAKIGVDTAEKEPLKVDVRDRDGRTPFHVAFFNGHAEVTRSPFSLESFEADCIE